MPDEPRVKVPVRADGLQLDENRGFQRGFWMAERIGWAGFVMVILLAMAGLTGRGGWFATAAHRAGAAIIEAPRVVRRGETAELRVEFGRDGGRHLLGFDAALPERFDVESVAPHPFRSVAAGNGLALQFEAVGNAPHVVRLLLRARHAGLADLRIAADGAGATVRILILP